MKASVFFIVYFLAASILAALIAFPLFQLVGTDIFKFERWVTRSALLLLILGLIPCLKYFNLSFKTIGFNEAFFTFLRNLSRGFVFGLVILGAVVIALLFLDIRTLSSPFDLTVKLLLKALLSGIVVALLEETLFRGFFFKLTERWHNAFTAIFVSSFFYAILHFIKPIAHIDANNLSFLSGFEVIFNAFSSLSELFADDFFALYAVGIFLALVRIKTNSLSTCIGLHASWVFLIKITKELSDENNQSTFAWLTGQYDGVIGILACGWLLLLSVLISTNKTSKT
ncbi:MAG: CPBP family intramembrane metalloprotease [Cycloclasticus sp.]|nr:MAG: CPBP family intramembrane metalloprotease [Cycloclasticus sp.]